MEDCPEVMKGRLRYSLRISPRTLSLTREITIDEEKKLLTDINTSAQMAAPVMPFTVNEVRAAIRILNPKKALGYDLIT